MRLSKQLFTLYTSILLFLFCFTVRAQEYDDLPTFFECTSVTQITQSFDRAGVKSSILEKMMRDINRESLESSFEEEIIEELKKKPWRLSTILDLQDEFLLIKRQYKAGNIDEATTRTQLACALAKYLHRDYLDNFDIQSIFPPNSKAFKFYTAARELGFWKDVQGLIEEVPNTELSQGDNSSDTNPSIDPIKKENKLSTIDILFYIFMMLCVWVAISLALGILVGEKKFTNPIVKQAYDFLLLPFQWIKPFIFSDQLKKDKLKTQTSPSSTPAHTQEQKPNLAESRLYQQAPKESPISFSTPPSSDEDRFKKIEEELALLKNRPVVTETNTTTSKDPALLRATQELRLEIEALFKRMDEVETQLKALQQRPQATNPEMTLSVKNMASIQRMIKDALRDFEAKLQPNNTISSKPTLPPTTTTSRPIITTSQPTTTTLRPSLPELDFPAEKSTPPPESQAPVIPTSAGQNPGKTLDLNPKVSQPSAPLVWYASSPQRGLFYGRRLEPNFVPKQTVYKITIDRANPTKANYTLVDDKATVRLATNIPDSYILPAMEPQGHGKLSDAKNIGPVEPGLLEKDGDNWRIIQKGILYYE